LPQRRRATRSVPAEPPHPLARPTWETREVAAPPLRLPSETLPARCFRCNFSAKLLRLRGL
jgi:hypothetical protein